MALISEVYFLMVDRDWQIDTNKQWKNANVKAFELQSAGCKFADFGTRRRRNKDAQEIVINAMRTYESFLGTSNPHFAMVYNTNVLGTLAHEVISGVSALESLNHPNKLTMEKWNEVFSGELSIFLPDTYGLQSFLKDFSPRKAKYWKGVRHDSGCPFDFTDRMVNYYKKCNIDPTSKVIIFSDSLDVNKAIKIKEYCDGKIQCSFGIGTHFTSDFIKVTHERSKPMNMVIKLVKCNGENVCKLSQNPEKAMGDPEAIRLMNHLHFGKPL
jgi:nicotinate phosphoribosyltransferase